MPRIMSLIRESDSEATIEGVRLGDLAERFGTPTLIYSRAEINARVTAFASAFGALDHLPCFAVKANNNLSILSLMATRGMGFDVVSGNELERVLRARGDASKVVFSGVGKLAGELDFALCSGVLSINVESSDEFELALERAKLAGIQAPLSVRINPDIRVSTHPYIATGEKTTKFGVSAEQAAQLLLRAHASKHARAVGLACHLGSQMTDAEPLLRACSLLLSVVDELQTRGVELEFIDLGGGFGVRYNNEREFELGGYARAILGQIEGRGLKLVTEPGRFLIANAGILLTRIIRTKTNDAQRFAIVDAAMNDLIRPSLYQAWHRVSRASLPSDEASEGPWEIVGPICETADTLASGRELAIAKDDLLCIDSCGAYVSVLSSNYNARNRVAEVLVDGDSARLIRRRECLNDQLALETPYLA